MQKVTILCTGKLKEKFYQEACAEYVKRLSAYCRLTLVELPEEKLPQAPSQGQIDQALAREAAAAGEVPVGCVIVRQGVVIGRGRNRREEKQAVSSHAEMEAMAQANAALGSWRLDDCELYVTLEPCPMCAGAILNARIPKVYYGARDRAFGACGGVTNLFMEQFPHRPALVGGILAEDCQAVLAEFFEKLRQGKPSTQSF